MTTLKLTITITETFDEDMNDKVARFLRDVANHVGAGLPGTKLQKPDGETVGEFKIDIAE